MELTTAQRINNAIELYCDWINAALDKDKDVEFRYTAAMFYERRLIVDYETTGYRVIVLSIYDGDEGGYHTITTYWDEDTLHAMTQEFDSGLHFIYNDGKMVVQDNEEVINFTLHE